MVIPFNQTAWSYVIAIAASSLLTTSQAAAQKEHAPIPDDIPYGRRLEPREERPIFAVCSKQGMRVLVSGDDGQTWEQTFLGTDSIEDGGWHGTFAVYGMAATDGVIGLFSGWGTPGVYIGSDDGRTWGHMTGGPTELGSVWSATAGNGRFLTSADQWRGVMFATRPYDEWTPVSVKEPLAGGKTHHMICGFGDYDGGRFVVVGDNHHVFYSDDCRSWRHSTIPAEAGKNGKGQEAVAYANGVFVCSYSNGVARSDDGGVTWTFHETGLRGWGGSWRGLSVVNDEFWITAKNGSHARQSTDGITWTDLPESTPGGRFIQADSGTIINVERRRYDIKRSTDGVRWETVFVAPEENVTWDTAFGVFARVRAVR